MARESPRRGKGEHLLKSFAERAGFDIQQDLVDVTRLDKSLVSRYWTLSTWLDRIPRAPFAALAEAIPELRSHEEEISRRRVEQAARRLGDLGVDVHLDRVGAVLLDGAPPAYVDAALHAGAKLLRSESDEELLNNARKLSAFWTHGPGKVFERILTTDAEVALLVNHREVVTQAARLLVLLSQSGRGRSSQPRVHRARDVLVHYIAYTDAMPPLPQHYADDSFRPVLARRCEIMSQLIRDDDYDLAEAYRVKVMEDTFAGDVERWMNLAWTRDVENLDSPIVPPGTRLRNTANEILSQIARSKYTGAYLTYLARVFIPFALRIDPQFGGRRKEVLSNFARRFETTVPSDRLEAAVEDLRKHMAN